MLDIKLETKLEDIVKAENKMMDFFNEHRIDYCCHGYMTVHEAANENNLDEEKLLDDIKVAMQNLQQTDNLEQEIDLEDFKNLSVEDMINSVIATHHAIERELLMSIDPLLNKILMVHFSHHGKELLELHKLFGALKTELEQHFIIEEAVTFPLMLENPQPDAETLAKIRDLEKDHEAAGELIKAMINLTDGFKVPNDACASYQKTFNDLDQLTKDIFIHIFKENSIIFPKYEKGTLK